MLNILKKAAKIKYLYVFICFPFVYRVKIGISDLPLTRLKQVAKSLERHTWMPVKMRCLFALPLINAKKTEQALHKAERLLISAEMPKDSSGYTEWFWIFNIYSGLIVTLCCVIFGVDCALLRGFVVVLLPLPIDAILFSLLLALLQYALIGCGAWIAYKFLFIISKIYLIQ